MKMVIISDTHRRHEELIIPEGDIIICCGDFSYNDVTAHVFLQWFSDLDFKYKVLIAGNHDEYFETRGKEEMKHTCKSIYDIIYLEDEGIEIEGIKFYGSPWTPMFFNWHFMKDDFDLKEIWDKIPKDTEVLITHGPEKGVLDRAPDHHGYNHTGSGTLRRRLLELPNLKYHFFGHIHGETGIVEKDEFKKFVSVNASSVREYNDRRPDIKEPIEIEI